MANRECCTTQSSALSPSSRAIVSLPHGVTSEDTNFAAVVVDHPRGKSLAHIARHAFTVYYRLSTGVLLFNIAGLIVLVCQTTDWSDDPPLVHLSTAAAANATAALLIRQDFVINLLFKTCWLVPHVVPLRIRCMLAKIYEYGGVHTGAGISSTLWFFLFTGCLTQQYVCHELSDTGIVCTAYILSCLLASVCTVAHPKFRSLFHNTFENVHRWGGYMSLILFWIELALFAAMESISIGSAMLRLPATWLLLIASILAVLPWLRLRKVVVEAEFLSKQAIRLYFPETTPIGGYGVKISNSPLTEWHSFASIPSRNTAILPVYLKKQPQPSSTSSVLIANAGDWTNKTIHAPRSHYYIKGLPTTGFLSTARLFRRIVLVTTGSGIGPCLSVILDFPYNNSKHTPSTSTHIIWSTPDPLVSYGKDICDLVAGVDGKALIWNTREKGRPDLFALALEAFDREKAEAVFVISNRRVTKELVVKLRDREVPAFGPIFDS